jgi:hypothetical protein
MGYYKLLYLTAILDFLMVVKSFLLILLQTAYFFSISTYPVALSTSQFYIFHGPIHMFCVTCANSRLVYFLFQL